MARVGVAGPPDDFPLLGGKPGHDANHRVGLGRGPDAGYRLPVKLRRRHTPLHLPDQLPADQELIHRVAHVSKVQGRKSTRPVLEAL